MAGMFRFELVSPEKLLFSEEVESVILPGSEGYLTVMANHSPLMVRIIPGVVRVKATGREDRAFVVFSGFADITPENCSLLAESAIPLGEFDRAELERRIAKVREEFKTARTVEHRNRAEEFLHQLTTVAGVDTLA